MDLIDPDVETSDRSAGIEWVDKTDGTFKITLPTKLIACDTDNNNMTDSTTIHYRGSTTAKSIPVTSSNRITRLIYLYEVTNVQETLEAAGQDRVQLTYRIQTDVTNLTLPLLNYDNYATATPGVNETMIQCPRGLYVGIGDGETKVFYFTAYAQLDASAVDSNGNTILKVYWQFEGDDAKIEQSASTYTIDNSEVASNDRISITFDSAPITGAIITIDYDSNPVALTLADSLTGCTTSGLWTTYWVSGDYIYWGASQHTDVKIAYRTKIDYGIGTDVVITDAKEGILSFPVVGKTPNITATGGTTLGISLKYQPEWIGLNTAVSLQGGTDGTDVSDYDMYNLVYDFLLNYADAYPVDLMVPLGMYLDSTKEIYSQDTGFLSDVNAGYHTLFHDYCEAHRDYHETHVIFGVTPLVSGAASNRPELVLDWYNKLIYTSTADPLRAANILAAFTSKWVSITAMMPIYSNEYSNGQAYRSSDEYPGSVGAASYAGLIAALNVDRTQSDFRAATHKPLGGIVGTYINLSDRRVDALVGRRYVVLRNLPGIGLVVASDVTCDSDTGDFHFFSNFEVVQHVTNAIREIGNQGFIGNGWTDEKKAALETSITRLFDSLHDRGIIKAANFKIKANSADAQRGIIYLDLIVVPTIQVQVIQTTIALRAKLSEL